MNNNDAKLKRVVIKEELVELTGDYKPAILLGQFLYWSERVKDYDYFKLEENKRLSDHNFEEIELSHGWIYKTASELSDEVMVNMSDSTIRRHIKTLVEKGWLHQRRNPKYKWDKTLQYRVNILQLRIDLDKLGYVLEGYSKIDDRISKMKIGNSKIETCNEQNERAIPETTSETTITEITNKDYNNIHNFNKPKVDIGVKNKFYNDYEEIESHFKQYTDNENIIELVGYFWTALYNHNEVKQGVLSDYRIKHIIEQIDSAYYEEYIVNDYDINYIEYREEIHEMIYYYFAENRKYYSLQEFAQLDNFRIWRERMK